MNELAKYLPFINLSLKLSAQKGLSDDAPAACKLKAETGIRVQQVSPGCCLGGVRGSSFLDPGSIVGSASSSALRAIED
jgi:hypothetical protein